MRETRHDEFLEFHEREAAAVLRYARAVLGPGRQQEVEDAAQDAWGRAWRSWESASPTHRRAWVFRIVRNCCLDRKGQPQHDQLPPAVADVLAASRTRDPLDGLDATAGLALLDDLTRPLREALYLRVVEERSYDEIATILDIPIGTVMSRLHAARRKLAKRLGPR